MVTLASTLRQAWSREDVAPLAVSVACDALARVAAGEVRARHVGDVAELVRACVDIARLEAGEATSAAVVAHITADRSAEVARLRAAAVAALSTTALAAADGDGPVLDVDQVEEEDPPAGRA